MTIASRGCLWESKLKRTAMTQLVKQVHQQALALLRPQDKLERGVGILQEMG